MILLDVNLWIPALRPDHAQHEFVTDWMTGIRSEGEVIGVSELALSGAVRLMTHPRVFDPPSDPDTAMSACANVDGRSWYADRPPGRPALADLRSLGPRGCGPRERRAGRLPRGPGDRARRDARVLRPGARAVSRSAPDRSVRESRCLTHGLSGDERRVRAARERRALARLPRHRTARLARPRTAWRSRRRRLLRAERRPRPAGAERRDPRREPARADRRRRGGRQRHPARGGHRIDSAGSGAARRARRSRRRPVRPAPRWGGGSVRPARTYCSARSRTSTRIRATR